ncbi:MAG: DUF309 domain-containing protein [Sulfurimonas sp.]|uniref:DUF309 domain-containing protein n=1 Tax=Sulfurimonas sp. TaxID=2022749 RepID=UPI002630F830|nr:DUF309 domain-containing protein [Sulfurimonas sp.]MDD5372875.1 DUF309 domain-containing protein [Sulfurimonas sp.]
MAYKYGGFFMIELEEHLNNFIQNLRDEKFYDAHDDLESIWFARRFEESDEIKLLKGFINASVSFELLKRGKAEPSQKVWKNYLKYRDLVHSVNSPYIDKYYQIIEEIERIKKSFINL